MGIEALDKLANALKKPARLETIGAMAAGMIQDHIHGGKGFKPLSPTTQDYRGEGKPLLDTTELWKSITYKVVDDRTVSVGTVNPYAAIQNYGGIIRAKNVKWLWIPGPGIRQIERSKKSGGWGPTNVLNTLKSSGNSIFRMGRTIRYWPKGKKPPKDTKEYPVAYYLKKSVEIPARKFFYLDDKEINLLMKEVGVEIEQL